ncbi:MAG: TrkH family potassium uptake protein [Bacteroidales bacterium]|nr:TrkH family potassium uptake protein [Bacteroidales bacterium]
MKKKIIGQNLVMVSLLMLASAFVALYYNVNYGETDFVPLLVPSLATFALGFILFLLGRKSTQKLRKEDNFFIVTLTWVILTVFGMVPYLMCGTFDKVSDAFFETMSGFTTTGATVMNNIDSQPHGILLWRSVTQWLGGLGVIVLTMAFFSQKNKAHETQLFSAESPGIEVDKLGSRIRNTAQKLWVIYIILTVLCFVAYYLGPMNLFDAVCHSMTTVATGGFSTHQASIGYWASPYIEYMCTLFMAMCGLTLALYYFLIVGRFKAFSKNEEMRWYFGIMFAGVAVFMLMFYSLEYTTVLTAEQLSSFPMGFEETFRTSLFNVVSVMTSSGYQAGCYDYVAWGQAFIIPTVLLMAVGGCSGSTSGGIKVSRIAIAVKNLIADLKRQLHPQAVIPVKMSKRSLEQTTVMRVMAFIMMYIITVLVATLLLTCLGMDFTSSFVSCLTAMSNIGPGYGMTGPATTFAAIPDVAKWILSGMMLVGRLEIFTVLLLFTKEYKVTK